MKTPGDSANFENFGSSNIKISNKLSINTVLEVNGQPAKPQAFVQPSSDNMHPGSVLISRQTSLVFKVISRTEDRFVLHSKNGELKNVPLSVIQQSFFLVLYES